MLDDRFIIVMMGFVGLSDRGVQLPIPLIRYWTVYETTLPPVLAGDQLNVSADEVAPTNARLDTGPGGAAELTAPEAAETAARAMVPALDAQTNNRAWADPLKPAPPSVATIPGPQKTPPPKAVRMSQVKPLPIRPVLSVRITFAPVTTRTLPL